MAAPMGPEELRRLHEAAIRLVAENKINKDNAWDNKYLTYCGECIKSIEIEDGLDFQQFSSGIQAAATIYGFKADGLYKKVYEQLQSCKGVKAVPGDLEAGDAGADGPDAEGSKGGKSVQRKRSPTAEEGEDSYSQLPSTLTTAAALRSKKCVHTLDKDPLFQHTTQLFDENSPSGLLTLNYSVGHGCQIGFDGCTPLGVGAPPPAAPAPQQTVMLSPLASDLARVLLRPATKLMTPGMDRLLDLAHQQQQPNLQLDNDAMLRACLPAIPVLRNSTVFAQGAHSQGEPVASAATAPDPDAMDVDMDAGGDTWADPGMAEQDDFQGNDSGAGDAEAQERWEGGQGGSWFETEVDLGPSLQGAPAMEAGVGLGDDLGGGEEGEEDTETLDTVGARSTEFDLLFSQGARSEPTRPVSKNIWRHKVNKTGAGGKAAKGAARARRKQPSMLDFSGPPPPAIECTTHKSISTTKRIIKNHTLPAMQTSQALDWSLLFDDGSGCGVSYLDLWRWEGKHTRQQQQRPQQQRAGAQAEQVPGGQGDGDKDLEADAGGNLGGGLQWAAENDTGSDYGGGQSPEPAGGDYMEGAEYGDDDTLIRSDQLPQVRNNLSSAEALLYGARRLPLLHSYTPHNQVDVKALKLSLKDKLSKRAARTSAMQGTPVADFGQVIQELPVDTAGQQVSVHLAFICLLHLANEHSLALSTGGRLDHLDVAMPNKL